MLADGGQIHFKTDNSDLFAYSVEQFTYCGYHLTELTHNLHKNGIKGIMTDYEEKFYKQGIEIKRCVANKWSRIYEDELKNSDLMDDDWYKIFDCIKI